ncbi:MAG: hypothetical protein WCI61_03765 [Chloroflexota bacterium]
MDRLWKQLPNGSLESSGLGKALAAISDAHPPSVLPKKYARPGLDKAALGSLLRLVSDIEVGSEAAKSQDVISIYGQEPRSIWKSGRSARMFVSVCRYRSRFELSSPYGGQENPDSTNRVFDPEIIDVPRRTHRARG